MTVACRVLKRFGLVQDDKAGAYAARSLRLWDMAYVLLVIVALLWAGNSIVGRAVRDDIPPFSLALVRWSGALLLLAPFAWARFRRDAPILRRHWAPTLLLGLLGVGAFNALLYSGLHHTTATNALLIQALVPAFVLSFGGLLFRERSGAARIVAAGLSALGVTVIVLHGQIGEIWAIRPGRGDAMILAAVCAWALYMVLLRWQPPVHPTSFLMATFIVGIGAMLPLAAWEAMAGLRIRWSAETLGAVAYVATFPSLIAYLLFNRGIALVGPARAGQVVNLMPLFGAGLAVLLLDEPFGTYHLAGAVLILLGTLDLSAVAAAFGRALR